MSRNNLRSQIDAFRWSQLEIGRQGDPKLEASRPSRLAGAAAVPNAAAGAHPFKTASAQQARRSVRVFIADAALGNVSKGCDAGMWMEPETRERFSLIVDQVEKHEGFQKTAKVGRRHEACDRPVILSAGPSGDASNGCVLGFYIKHWFGLSKFRCQGLRAALSAAVHHSRSSIIVWACFSSSASPLSTSPPWKCAQRVATGMWTDERTGAI